jgi:short-subunit dehydrogenase
MRRRILITGGSDGLGKALALALTTPETDFILTGRRRAALEDAAQSLRETGARVESHIVELASSRAVVRLGNAVASDGAGLDVLIHNAAVIRLGRFAESNVADLDWHYRPNVRSPVLLTQLLLPQVVGARGQIVFINSAAGLSARKGAAFYAATKHALKAVADSLREELVPHGVSVLSVFPSRLNTRMQARVLEMEGASANMNAFLQPSDAASIIVQAMARCARGEIGNVVLKIGQAPSFG